MTKDQQAEKRETRDLPMYRLKCPHWSRERQESEKGEKEKRTRKKTLKMQTENNYTEVTTDKPFINH